MILSGWRLNPRHSAYKIPAVQHQVAGGSGTELFPKMPIPDMPLLNFYCHQYLWVFLAK